MIFTSKKKLQTKLKRVNAPIQASLWFLICGFLQKAIAMLTTPIYTRILSTQDYGVYTIYQSWFNIISIIATLNLAAEVYTSGLVKNEEDRDAFSSSLMGLATTSITIWFIIYIIGHQMWNKLFQLPTVLIVGIFIDLYFYVAYQFWSNRERVNYRYKKLVLLTISNVVLTQGLGIILVLNSNIYKVELRIISSIVVNVILFAGLLVNIFNRGKKFYSPKYWKYALLFNLPLIPHYLSQIVLNQSDRLMINAFCGKEEAGIYGVAYSIAMVMQIFSFAISSTMNPWIYKSIKGQDYKSIGRVSYYILMVVAFVNFGLIALAPEALKIMAPASYQSAVWIIPPVTVSVYFMFLYNLFVTFECYFEKTKYVMIASVTGACLNLLLNYIFIPIYGFLAAGYTTLVCYILYAVAHYLFMRKVCNKFIGGEKIYNIKIIILIGFTLIVCSVFMMRFYDTIAVRYILLFAGMTFVYMKRKRLLVIYNEMKRENSYEKTTT